MTSGLVCVDTSVWIAAFGTADSVEARHLSDLLDADLVILPVPVRLEPWGLRAGITVSWLTGWGAVPRAEPDPATWARMETWVTTAVESGQRFGLADLLIAATAVDHEARIWSFDADFSRMEKLGFVRRYSVR